MSITEEKKKVVLVESWSMMRTFMSECIGRVDGYAIDMVLPDAYSAYEFIRNNNIALLMMDLPANNEDEVLDIVKDIKKNSPSTRIIVTTLTSSAKLAEKVKASGADGLWQKEISETSLLKVI